MSNTIYKDLLKPQRFDFMAKLLYVYSYDNRLNTHFFRDLYENHMITFNGCKELPDSTIDGCGITKNNIHDFFKDFHSLIENMKHNGFDPSYAIPVGTDGLLENGTHRMITSYYYNIPPVIKRVTSPGQRYNYNFFLGRSGFPPLNRKYADAMALEYVNHNSNTRCMVLYPCAYNEQSIRNVFNIIQRYGEIYYHKEVKLNHIGLNNVIKELYRGEEWIGGNFPITGGYGKYKLSCLPCNPIIYISIVMNDVSKCIEMKEECRKIYNMGKHSLHVSDFTEDTWRISSCLLNENSIHFLNNCKTNVVDNHPNNMSIKTKNTLTTFFETVHTNKKDYCVTSSVILEMYGLRHAKDIDYLHKSNFDVKKENIGVHDGIWISYYGHTKDDIIYNPQNHFYFNGFKFAAPHVIMRMKQNRNEPKDQNDIALLSRIL
jgi:hypothetical protein